MSLPFHESVFGQRAGSEGLGNTEAPAFPVQKNTSHQANIKETKSHKEFLQT